MAALGGSEKLSKRASPVAFYEMLLKPCNGKVWGEKIWGLQFVFVSCHLRIGVSNA